MMSTNQRIVYCKCTGDLTLQQVVHYVEDICGVVARSWLVSSKSQPSKLIIFMEFEEAHAVPTAIQNFSTTKLDMAVYVGNENIESYFKRKEYTILSKWKKQIPVLPSISMESLNDVDIREQNEPSDEEGEQEELVQLRTSFVNNLLHSKYVDKHVVDEERVLIEDLLNEEHDTRLVEKRSSSNERRQDYDSLRKASSNILKSINTGPIMDGFKTLSQQDSKKFMAEQRFKSRQYVQRKQNSTSLEKVFEDPNTDDEAPKKKGHRRQKASISFPSTSQKQISTEEKNMDFLRWSMVKRNVNNFLDWFIEDIDRNTAWGLFFVEKVSSGLTGDVTDDEKANLNRLLLHIDQTFENNYSEVEFPHKTNGHHFAWSVFDVLYNRMSKVTSRRIREMSMTAKVNTVVNLVHLNCGYQQLLVELRKLSKEMNCQKVDLAFAMSEDEAREKVESLLLKNFFNRPPPKSILEFDALHSRLKQLISFNIQSHQFKHRFHCDKEIHGFNCHVKYSLAEKNLEQINLDIESIENNTGGNSTCSIM